MLKSFIFLVGLGFFLIISYRKTKKFGTLWIAKGLLQIGILILFIFSFFKIYFNLPQNLYIKILFFITYVWCTVGINVNLMVPLLSLIDQKINKKEK